MRRLSLGLFVAVGVLSLLPDTAEAQIFRRRARRNDCCCMSSGYGGYGYGGSGCCGATYGGPAYGTSGCCGVSYTTSDCCGGGYAMGQYGGQPMVGYEQGGPYGPGPGYGPGAGYGPGGQPPYTSGYPNIGGGAQPMPSPGAPSIMIRDGAFEPARISVRAGDTVRWTNDGTKVHTVTADDGSFDSGNLEPGKTFSHKFDKEGTVNYHCTPHKDQMKGSVVVGPAAGGSVPGVPGAPGSRTQQAPQPTPRDREK